MGFISIVWTDPRIRTLAHPHTHTQRKAEEYQRKYEELVPQANEHKAMCEELLGMVETLQQQVAATGGQVA
jgi:uncharacterized protein involved in exopolysaccharide biosynthesis